MTQSEVEEVFNAKGTNIEISKKYGIHPNTVRNIKKEHSRAYIIWQEF